MYQLVYEGPLNQEPDTVRKIKSALLSKLNFSIDEIREIIEKTPATIVTADDESDLEDYYEELKSAGARVYIVREKKNIEIEISLDDEDKKAEPKVFSISEDIEELPFYEVSEEEEQALPEQQKAIELNEDETLQDLLEILNEKEETQEVAPSVKHSVKFQEQKEEEIFSFGEKIEEKLVEQQKEPEKKLKPIDFCFDDTEETNEKAQSQIKEEIIDKESVTERNEWDLSVEGADDIIPEVPIVKGSVSPNGEEVDLDSMLEEVQAIAPKEEETSKIEEISPIALKNEKQEPELPQTTKPEISKENYLPLLLMTIVLVSTLWAGNHFYFTTKEQKTDPVIEEPKPPKVSKEKKPTKPLNRDLKGAIVVNGGMATINISEEQGKLKRLAIVFRGDESRKLTPEEIVRRIPREPWIESLIFETTQFTFEEGGIAVSNGPVRISIQDDKQVKRVIGTGTANVKLDRDFAFISFFSTYQTSRRITGVNRENGNLAVSVVFDSKVELK